MDFEFLLSYFDILGDIFGKITSLSVMPYKDAINIMFGNIDSTKFTFVNLFTGVTSNFPANTFIANNPFSDVLNFLLDITGIPSNTPLWAFIIYFMFITGVTLTIVKWLLDIIF